MEINFFNNYGDINFDFQKILDDIASIFTNQENIKENISVICINNDEMQKINNQYRNLDCSTDVLSFPDRDEEYLGDIFISIDKVYEQAKQYNHSVEREFAFLLTHGILHLLGYDHENTNDEKKMIAKQEEILKKYRRV
ncbi:MAG TPA: rRNA maturation RNase YbeY [Acholeplasmataceae bacterium]|nr:rRNA maturation RNase YbeY [Acholeplasmataceae bacterium]